MKISHTANTVNTVDTVPVVRMSRKSVVEDVVMVLVERVVRKPIHTRATAQPYSQSSMILSLQDHYLGLTLAPYGRSASLLPDKQALLNVVHRAFYHAARVNGACDRAETLQSDELYILFS